MLKKQNKLKWPYLSQIALANGYNAITLSASIYILSHSVFIFHHYFKKNILEVSRMSEMQTRLLSAVPP